MSRLRYKPGDQTLRFFPDFHWAPKRAGEEIEVSEEAAAAVDSPFLIVVPDEPKEAPAKEAADKPAAKTDKSSPEHRA